MKLVRPSSIIICCVLLFNTQCNEDDGVLLPLTLCDAVTVINSELYENAESDFNSIVNVDISQNCLTITVSASGCSGDTWVFGLVGSETVMESSPVQRNVRLVLTNDEACLAVFTQEQSFDLSPLQVEGENEVLLSIQDFSDQIMYSY